MSIRIRGNSNAGSISVDGNSFGYASFGGRLYLYADEPFEPSGLAEAANALAKQADKPVVVNALAPPSAIVEHATDIVELRYRFDEALCEALTALGAGIGDVLGLDRGGMPSEYRGFLRQVERLAHAACSDPENRLFDEVIFATRSVAFGMRYGHATLWHAMAVGLRSLRDELSARRHT